MIIVDTFKDFLDGLSRGLGLFLSERNNMVEHTTAPRKALR